MRMDVDYTEVRRLLEDLGKVPGHVVSEVAAATRKGAQNIKDEMVREAEAELSGGHARRFPASISYDMVPAIGAIEYVIGPDKDRPQGALGNILYFGTSKNAQVLDINAPLDREQPRFLKALADAAAKAVDL